MLIWYYKIKTYNTSNMPRRFPIVFAALLFTLLATIWHREGHLPNPFAFISSYAIARPSFYEIALKHGTDKVTTHHYERMYEHRLAPLRDKPIKILEIGFGCDMDYGPGASYYTWLEYFSNLDLYYIEYDATCAQKWAYLTTGATIYTGDQADISFLQRFIQDTGGEFDVIIDDGGHTMEQQKTSLSVLWDAVKPGGVYFVEDLSTSYQRKYGGGLSADGKKPGKGTFMEDLKSMLDDINRWGMLPDVNNASKSLLGLEMTQEVVALSKMRGDERLGEFGH